MIMPNGKTHFIAGAVVGATVNIIVQSTEMAMDYDRPFDHRCRARRLGHLWQAHPEILASNPPCSLGFWHELPQPHCPRLRRSQTNQPHLNLCFCHFIFLPHLFAFEFPGIRVHPCSSVVASRLSQFPPFPRVRFLPQIKNRNSKIKNPLLVTPW
jgi:hypothetical protein